MVPPPSGESPFDDPAGAFNVSGGIDSKCPRSHEVFLASCGHRGRKDDLGFVAPVVVFGHVVWALDLVGGIDHTVVTVIKFACSREARRGCFRQTEGSVRRFVADRVVSNPRVRRTCTPPFVDFGRSASFGEPRCDRRRAKLLRSCFVWNTTGK